MHLCYKNFRVAANLPDNHENFTLWMSYAHPDPVDVKKIREEPFEAWMTEYWPRWREGVNSLRYLDMRAAFAAGQERPIK